MKTKRLCGPLEARVNPTSNPFHIWRQARTCMFTTYYVM